MASQTHRFMRSCGGDFHGGAVAVAGWGGRGTGVLLVGTARPPGAAGPQWAVALRAAAVDRLDKQSVDLLAQLDDIGRGDSSLTAHRLGEHVLVQRAPVSERGRSVIPLLCFKGNTSLYLFFKCLRSDFVTSDNKRHLPAPRVDEGGPAGVDGDVFSTAGAHPQGRVVEWLSCKLKDWKRTTGQV